jgi:hypothetical protein
MKPNAFALVLAFAVSAVTGMVLLSARPVLAQKGDNAVYSSTGLAASSAFIDASAFGHGSDICATINGILTGSLYNYPAIGAVIDARSFMPSTSYHGPQPCGSDPFFGVTKPSTVLLPASTIMLQVPWILPNNTRIIGEGGNTLLRACSTGGQSPCASNLSGDMIDMGSSSCAPCSGISVEHLSMDGQGMFVNGIVNNYAQESSYVNDVAIANIMLTSLYIQSGAADSGPYSNISSVCQNSVCNGHYSSSNPTVCISIQATIRGLHGVSCVANSSTTNQPVAGILLDANNNSIEDVHIEGFYDGVLIGSRGSAQGNVLLNVFGGYGAGPLTNTVHICNPSISTSGCTNHTGGSLTDLTLLQIGSVGNKSGRQSAPILDDLTATEPNSSLYDAYVGMYVVGNNQAAGYSRFTTSRGVNLYPGAPGGVPTLAIGVVVPTKSSTPCTTPGTIYSNTAGTQGGNNTVFVCQGNPLYWHAFKM